MTINKVGFSITDCCRCAICPAFEGVAFAGRELNVDLSVELASYLNWVGGGKRAAVSDKRNVDVVGSKDCVVGCVARRKRRWHRIDYLAVWRQTPAGERISFLLGRHSSEGNCAVSNADVVFSCSAGRGSVLENVCASCAKRCLGSICCPACFISSVFAWERNRGARRVSCIRRISRFIPANESITLAAWNAVVNLRVGLPLSSLLRRIIVKLAVVSVERNRYVVISKVSVVNVRVKLAKRLACARGFC